MLPVPADPLVFEPELTPGIPEGVGVEGTCPEPLDGLGDAPEGAPEEAPDGVFLDPPAIPEGVGEAAVPPPVPELCDEPCPRLVVDELEKGLAAAPVDAPPGTVGVTFAAPGVFAPAKVFEGVCTGAEGVLLADPLLPPEESVVVTMVVTVSVIVSSTVTMDGLQPPPLRPLLGDPGDW